MDTNKMQSDASDVSIKDESKTLIESSTLITNEKQIKRRTKNNEKKELESKNEKEKEKNLSPKESMIEKLKKIDSPIEFEIKSKIDGIEVVFNIQKEHKHHCGCRHNNEDNDGNNEKEKKLYYSLRLGLDNLYFEESFTNYFLLGHVYLDTPEELFEKIDTIKTLKWCKLRGNFFNPDSDKIQIMKLLDMCINNDPNEYNKCSVCYERCEEELQCHHNLCMPCRQKIIKYKKKRCPVCKTKEFNIQFVNDEDNDTEDDD